MTRRIKQYKRMETTFQEFDCEQDMEEDIIGEPEYIAIDGELYKNRKLLGKIKKVEK